MTFKVVNAQTWLPMTDLVSLNCTQESLGLEGSHCRRYFIGGVANNLRGFAFKGAGPSAPRRRVISQRMRLLCSLPLKFPAVPHYSSCLHSTWSGRHALPLLYRVSGVVRKTISCTMRGFYSQLQNPECTRVGYWRQS